MDMKKPVVILMLTILTVVSLNAQTLSNAQRREMNAQLLELIDKYDTYSTFSESYMQYGFVKLFESKESLVYCDFMSSSDFGKQITADDYTAYATEELSTLYPPSARSIKKGNYLYKDGKWHVSLTLERTISYIDKLGVYFNGDYELTLNCVYLSAEDMFLISSITGVDKSKYLYPASHFYVVNKTQPADEFVSQDGKALSYNDFKQAIAPSNDFAFNDGDVVLKTKTVGTTPRYSLLEFAYVPKKSRLSIHADYAPMSAYKIQSTTDFIQSKSSALEIGLDYGYMWKLSPKVRMGLGIGVALSNSNIYLEADDISYTLVLSDYGGPDNTYRYYDRRYDLSKVSEGMKFMDVTMPFYASLEASLGRSVNFVLDAGVKIYLNAKTTIEPYTIEGSVTNEYYPTTTPPYTTGLNLMPGYLSPTSYLRKVYDLTYFVKGGIDIRISKMNYITIRVGVENAIADSYTSDLHDWYSGTDYPVFYSNGQDMMVRSFVDCISYARQSLWVGIGYKIKL